MHGTQAMDSAKCEVRLQLKQPSNTHIQGQPNELVRHQREKRGLVATNGVKQNITTCTETMERKQLRNKTCLITSIGSTEEVSLYYMFYTSLAFISTALGCTIYPV